MKELTTSWKVLYYHGKLAAFPGSELLEELASTQKALDSKPVP